MDGSDIIRGEPTPLTRLPVTHGLVVAMTVMGILSSAPDFPLTVWLGHAATHIWMGETWRFLTSLVVCTNSLQMLACGIVMLIAGSLVEAQVGGVRLLLLYVVCGVAGGIASLLAQESCWSEMA